MIGAHTVRDQVAFSVTPAAIRKPAFEVINRVQRFAPGEQIVATAVALTAMAEAIGLDPHDLIQRAKNMMSAASGGRGASQVDAIREYAANEIGREVPLK